MASSKIAFPPLVLVLSEGIQASGPAISMQASQDCHSLTPSVWSQGSALPCHGNPERHQGSQRFSFLPANQAKKEKTPFSPGLRASAPLKANSFLEATSQQQKEPTRTSRLRRLNSCCCYCSPPTALCSPACFEVEAGRGSSRSHKACERSNKYSCETGAQPGLVTYLNVKVKPTLPTTLPRPIVRVEPKH